MWPFRKKKSGGFVNVDDPVENPALVAAIENHQAWNAHGISPGLHRELNRANYLLAVLDDHSNMVEAQGGSSAIGKGSRMTVLCCSNENGKNLVILFTDWNQVKAWTKESVSGLIVPAAQTWRFVLAQPLYSGAVINPGGIPVELDRDQIRMLESGKEIRLPQSDQSVVIENPEIVDLLEQVQSHPALRQRIYDLLANTNLVLGTREPVGAVGQWTVADADAEITLMTTTAPDGGPALPVFTDAAALRARNPEAFPAGMPTTQIVSMIIEDGYRGIVLNPAGNWIFIPRDDLCEIALAADNVS